jgi:hypothetical protein
MDDHNEKSPTADGSLEEPLLGSGGELGDDRSVGADGSSTHDMLTGLDPDATVTTTEHLTSETPENNNSLMGKIRDKLKSIQEQHEDNIFDYISIIAQFAKTATAKSGEFVDKDDSKEPFTQLVFTVESEELSLFFKNHETIVNLGLPTDVELSADIYWRGDEDRGNRITVQFPLSGQATEAFFSGREVVPIVQKAFDEAYVKRVTEQSLSQGPRQD